MGQILRENAGLCEKITNKHPEIDQTINSEFATVKITVMYAENPEALIK